MLMASNCVQRVIPAHYHRASSPGWGGGGVLGLIFGGYVQLASQSPYPIIVYSVANYIPHLSPLWENM